MCFSPDSSSKVRRAVFLAPELGVPPRNGMALKCATVLEAISLDWRCHVITPSESPFHPGVRYTAQDFRQCYPHADAFTILDLPAVVFPRRQWRALNSALRLSSPSAARYLNDRGQRIVRNLLLRGSCEVVYCDLYPYVKCIPKVLLGRTLLSINDAHGLGFLRSAEATTKSWRKVVQAFRHRYYDHFENITLRTVRAVHVVTQADKDYLINRHQLDNVHVIPIAVGAAYFRARVQDYTSYRVLVHGEFTAEERRVAVTQFVKRAVARGYLGKVVWVLLGHGSAAMAREFPSASSIEALDYVDDHASLLASCAYGIYPERAGSGTKNRIVQHMAVGACVITTPEMLRGIPGAQEGQHLLVASSADGQVDLLASALEGPIKSAEIGGAGRSFCREAFAPSRVGQQWRDLFDLVSK